jgi:valyl-tRNA synthetase
MRPAERRWRMMGKQASSRDPADPRPPLSDRHPPPTVSGTIHIGHILVCPPRRWRALARPQRVSFGFDDNGLLTERFVESCGIRARDLSRPFTRPASKSHAVEDRRTFWRGLV